MRRDISPALCLFKTKENGKYTGKPNTDGSFRLAETCVCRGRSKNGLDKRGRIHYINRGCLSEIRQTALPKTVGAGHSPVRAAKA